MKKSAFVFYTLMFLMMSTFAQNSKRDVIYLKNGSIINGQIVSAIPSGEVKIKTRDNSLWVFEPAQIDSIRKSGNHSAAMRSGCFNLTEAGILVGNPGNKYQSPFSLINISGWHFKNGFSVGAGTGVEFFSETYLPVVADFRYYLKYQDANPFFEIQGGYSFSLDRPDSQYVSRNSNIWPEPSGSTMEIKAKGGLLLNPAIGILTPLDDHLSLAFSIGYRIMRHHYEREDDYKIDIDYNRLVLKIGLLF